MIFNSVKVIITNAGEDFANVKVEFDPPLPENEEDIEDQPCLVLLDAMLEAIQAEDNILESAQEYLQ